MQQQATNEIVLKLENYIFQKTIGQGAFGKVKLAIHEQTNIQVAIKIMNKSRLKKSNVYQKTKREIQYLRLLDHPNIIKLIEVLESRENIYIVMEYLEKGDLYELISEKSRLTESEAHHYFCQIIQAVEYCHSSLITHRDMKLENLLINKKDIVKLADFGLSNIMKDGKYLTTSCGSPHYAAPEIIEAKPYCGTCIDCWSVGVILFTLVSGTLPFDEEIYQKLFKKIREADFKMPSYFSPQLKDLLTNIMRVEPTSRLPFSQIKYHPWVKQYIPTCDHFLFQQQYTQRLNKQLDLNETIIAGLIKINPCFRQLTMQKVKDCLKKTQRDKEQENIQSSYNLLAINEKLKEMAEHQQKSLVFCDLYSRLYQEQQIKTTGGKETDWMYGVVSSESPRQVMAALMAVLTTMNSVIIDKLKTYQLTCYYKSEKSHMNQDRLIYNDAFSTKYKQHLMSGKAIRKHSQNAILFTIQLYGLSKEKSLLNIILNKGHPLLFLEFINRLIFLFNRQFIY